MKYALAGQGVFTTWQGEGLYSGVRQVFVRLAGCSVGCPGCDTDYRVARKVLVGELVSMACEDPRIRWVWITGGEPTDRPLAPLVEGLQAAGKLVAVATAGVRALDCEPDHVSVSPHTHARLPVGLLPDEIKLVPGLNGLNPWAWLEANFDLDCDYRWLQPLWGDEDSLKTCLDMTEKLPQWQLTIQAHKYWGVP